MKELNPYILLVMQWLNDNESATHDELINNRDAAYATAYAAAVDTATYAVDSATYAAYSAADAAADANADAAEKWVNKYFERTSEDKQLYIDALTADGE